MTTVHVSIGNTDGKLSHVEWSEYYALVDGWLRRRAGNATTQVYGRWHSLPATPYVNACWAIEVPEDDIEVLKKVLARIAGRFGQDSVAWLAGETEFIAGEGP